MPGTPAALTSGGAGPPRQLPPSLSFPELFLAGAGTRAGTGPRALGSALATAAPGLRPRGGGAEGTRGPESQGPSPDPVRAHPGGAGLVTPAEDVPGTQGAPTVCKPRACSIPFPRRPPLAAPFPGEETEARSGPDAHRPERAQPRCPCARGGRGRCGPGGDGPGGGYLWRRRRPRARACRGSPSAPSPACPGSAGARPTHRRPRAPPATRGCSPRRARRWGARRGRSCCQLDGSPRTRLPTRPPRPCRALWAGGGSGGRTRERTARPLAAARGRARVGSGPRPPGLALSLRGASSAPCAQPHASSGPFLPRFPPLSPPREAPSVLGCEDLRVFQSRLEAL